MIISFWPRRLIAWSALVIAVVIAYAVATVRSAQLLDNARWTGFILLGIFLVLGAYNLRKRLSSLPLARSAIWLQWHLYLGLGALALIHLHIGWHFPSGAFSWLLYVLFWATSLTGLLGILLTRTIPKMLTALGGEIIYERIPNRVAQLHEEAISIVTDALNHPEGDLVAGFFIDRLDGFLCRPMFSWQTKRDHWIKQQCASAARMAGAELTVYVQDLGSIAEEKLRLDRHYLLQGILKIWLFVHIPLAVAALAAAIYHTVFSIWFGG